MKGSYLLLIELPVKTTIKIGKLGLIDFPSGWYVYVGSAMNGIESRIKRHFSLNKNFHWHIDYFIDTAHLKQAYYKKSKIKEECAISERLNLLFDSIPLFGSSDCECSSHLFYGDKEKIIEFINSQDFVRVDEKEFI